MAIKTYSFAYATYEAEVTFKVDTDIFTAERALEILTFFIWDHPYDRGADAIDEVMRKYAVQAIEFSTFNRHNELGVKSDFDTCEGFYPVDGTFGIELISISGYDIDESYLTVEVTNA